MSSQILRFLVAGLGAAAACGAAAQELRALREFGPWGGDVSDVAPSPTAAGVVLAGLDTGMVGPAGIFRSTDSGATWHLVTTPVPNAHVYRFAFAPSRTVYAAFMTGLMKSVDDGETWSTLSFQPVSTAKLVYAVAVDPSDSQTVWAAIREEPLGVLRSTDGGTTWTQRSPSSAANTRDIVVDPRDGHVVVAVGAGFVNVTTDAGATWANRVNGLPNQTYRAAAFAGTRLLVGAVGTFGTAPQGGLYASDDLGMTWSPLHDASWPTLDVTDIEVDPANPARIFVATAGHGVYRTIDGGATWQFPPATQRLVANSVRLGGSGELYVGSVSQAVLKSADGGATLAPSSSGMRRYNVDAIDVNPLDSDDIAMALNASDSGAVLRTQDGGDNWQIESLPLARYTRVAYAPDGTLFAVSSGPAGFGLAGPYRRNGDGTWTWLGVATGRSNSDRNTLRFVSGVPQRIYLSGSTSLGGATLWRSDNFGASWTEAYSLGWATRIADLETADIAGETYLLMAAEGNGEGWVSRSTNDWSWSSTGSGLPLATNGANVRLCRAGGPSPALFASMDRRLMRLADGTASWLQTGSFSLKNNAIACDAAGNLYAADDGRLLRSTNNGATLVAYTEQVMTARSANELIAREVNGATELFLATGGGAFTTAVRDAIFHSGFE